VDDLDEEAPGIALALVDNHFAVVAGLLLIDSVGEKEVCIAFDRLSVLID
jgi:hypothetical protein